MLETMYQRAKALGVIQQDGEQIDKSDFQLILVAPLGTSVPEDGLMSYVTVDTFKDILSANSGSVVLFREDQAEKLALLCANADALECEIQALYGLPGTVYDRWFEEASYNAERISYAPLVAKIRDDAEVQQIQDAKLVKSRHEIEVKQRTNKRGRVRYNDDSIGIVDDDDDET